MARNDSEWVDDNEDFVILDTLRSERRTRLASTLERCLERAKKLGMKEFEALATLLLGRAQKKMEIVGNAANMYLEMAQVQATFSSDLSLNDCIQSTSNSATLVEVTRCSELAERLSKAARTLRRFSQIQPGKLSVVPSRLNQDLEDVCLDYFGFRRIPGNDFSVEFPSVCSRARVVVGADASYSRITDFVDSKGRQFLNPSPSTVGEVRVAKSRALSHMACRASSYAANIYARLLKLEEASSTGMSMTSSKVAKHLQTIEYGERLEDEYQFVLGNDAGELSKVFLQLSRNKFGGIAELVFNSGLQYYTKSRTHVSLVQDTHKALAMNQSLHRKLSRAFKVYVSHLRARISGVESDANEGYSRPSLGIYLMYAHAVFFETNLFSSAGAPEDAATNANKQFVRLLEVLETRSQGKTVNTVERGNPGIVSIELLDRKQIEKFGIHRTLNAARPHMHVSEPLFVAYFKLYSKCDSDQNAFEDLVFACRELNQLMKSLSYAGREYGIGSHSHDLVYLFSLQVVVSLNLLLAMLPLVASESSDEDAHTHSSMIMTLYDFQIHLETPTFPSKILLEKLTRAKLHAACVASKGTQQTERAKIFKGRTKELLLQLSLSMRIFTESLVMSNFPSTMASRSSIVREDAMALNVTKWMDANDEAALMHAQRFLLIVAVNSHMFSVVESWCFRANNAETVVPRLPRIALAYANGIERCVLEFASVCDHVAAPSTLAPRTILSPTDAYERLAHLGCEIILCQIIDGQYSYSELSDGPSFVSSNAVINAESGSLEEDITAVDFPLSQFASPEGGDETIDLYDTGRRYFHVQGHSDKEGRASERDASVAIQAFYRLRFAKMRRIRREERKLNDDDPALLAQMGEGNVDLVAQNAVPKTRPSVTPETGDDCCIDWSLMAHDVRAQHERMLTDKWSSQTASMDGILLSESVKARVIAIVESAIRSLAELYELLQRLSHIKAFLDADKIVAAAIQVEQIDIKVVFTERTYKDLHQNVINLLVGVDSPEAASRPQENLLEQLANSEKVASDHLKKSELWWAEYKRQAATRIDNKSSIEGNVDEEDLAVAASVVSIHVQEKKEKKKRQSGRGTMTRERGGFVQHRKGGRNIVEADY